MNRLIKSILAVLIFNAFLITGSIISGAKRGDITHYFAEGETVTFFSALFLGLSAWVAFLSSYLHVRLDKAHPFFNFWSLSAAGFFFLMLDENFMIHEGMDRAILRSIGLPARLYNFDGWILALYGVIGIILIIRHRRHLGEFPEFMLLIKLALGCFLLMVLADHFDIGSAALDVIEDSFKILGVSFFLAAYTNAFFTGIGRVMGNNPSQPRQ